VELTRQKGNGQNIGQYVSIVPYIGAGEGINFEKLRCASRAVVRSVEEVDYHSRRLFPIPKLSRGSAIWTQGKLFGQIGIQITNYQITFFFK